MTPRPLLDALARDPQKALADIAAERARRRAVAAGRWSFAEFAQNAWSVVDQRPLQWNPYLADLALHLDAAARGRIRRLVGNGPPRFGKSNLFAIMWPAWIWATVNPAECFIYLSYADKLVTEHSMKCRALIDSPWYQDTFRPSWRLGIDGNTTNRQDDFANSAGGRRIASSIKAGVIGRGATRICIDDPVGVEEARSTAEKDRAREAVQQAVSTRFNDPATGVAVLLMQRMAPDDPSQTFIDAGWEHFCTPMERDEREFVTHEVVDGVRRELWRDRRAFGEMLHPERFPAEILRQIKAGMSVAAYAAQFAQRPISDERAGTYFNRAPMGAPLRFVDAAPLKVKRRVRAWDLASTENGGDWTVGVKLSLLEDNTLCVEDVVRGQWGPREVRATVKTTAETDGTDVEVVLPQDPGQAGKDQAQEYVTMLFGWTVTTRRPDKKKEVRAGPASAQWMAGNMSLVRALWNDPFLQILCAFPDPAAHDDDVDALADAVAHVAQPITTADLWAAASAQGATEKEEIERFLRG